MQVTRGFKKTEIGFMPNDWRIEELGGICSPSASRISPVTSKRKYKCIELEHLSQGSGKLLGYTQSRNLLSQKTIFRKGDVLFGKLRPYLRKFLVAEFDGVCSTEIWVLKNANNVSNRFLYYLIQSDRIIEAANISTGTKMPRAEWKVVSRTKVPLPSALEEQAAIATALSDADALIISLEKLIDKKRAIKQGAMQDLLKPKKGWEMKKMKDAAPLQRGFDLPNKDLREGKYPVVYSNGIVNYHFKYQAKAPGIVTGRSGTIGRVNYIEEDFWPHNTTLWVTGFKSNHPKFLYFLFLYIKIERFASGSGVPTLNRNDVHEYAVAIPPVEEQKRIAEVLSDLDSEINALESKLEKYRQIKTGMMQNLLTGKIRLV